LRESASELPLRKQRSSRREGPMPSGLQSGGVGGGPAPSGLADVIDTILDKGLVIDAYVRVSLVGIELLTIDARVVRTRRGCRKSSAGRTSPRT